MQVASLLLQSMRDHWRGNAEILPLIVINLGGTAAILGWIFSTYPIGMTPWFLILLLPIVIWQIVGTFRAASNMLGQSSGLFMALASFGVLICVIIYLAAGLVGVLANRFVDPNLGEFVPPELRVKPIADGRGLALSGDIDYEMLAQFDKASSASVEFVTLQSQGGNIYAARAMAQRFIAAQLDTKAAGNCFSACTLLFMAGRGREIGLDGSLGFHGYGLDSQINRADLDMVAEQQKDIDFFVSRGVSQKFARRALAVDHSEIWVPTAEILLAAGVLTKR